MCVGVFGYICVCVIKLRGSTAQQLLCNGVQWESAGETHTACVHAWPGWHPRASLFLKLAHSCARRQSRLFLKPPANQHCVPCLNTGANLSCQQPKSKLSKLDETGTKLRERERERCCILQKTSTITTLPHPKPIAPCLWHSSEHALAAIVPQYLAHRLFIKPLLSLSLSFFIHSFFSFPQPCDPMTGLLAH